MTHLLLTITLWGRKYYCLFLPIRNWGTELLKKNVSLRLHLSKLLEPEYKARQLTFRAHSLNYEPHLTKVIHWWWRRYWRSPSSKEYEGRKEPLQKLEYDKIIRDIESSVETWNYRLKVLSINLVMWFAPEDLSYLNAGTEKTDYCVYLRLAFIGYSKMTKRQRRVKVAAIIYRERGFGEYISHIKMLFLLC